MKRSAFAARVNLLELAKTGKLYMWTFTRLPIWESMKQQREAWNKLLTYLKRRWPNWKGVRVFEMHKANEAGLTHGMHVHVVTTGFISVTEVRAICERTHGWGRVHVKEMDPDKASYVAKYLDKERPGAFKGWRLWAAFGDYAKTRAKDVQSDSPFTRVYEWLDMKFPDSFASEPWFVRQGMCEYYLKWLAYSGADIERHGFRGDEDHRVWLVGSLNPEQRPDRKKRLHEHYLRYSRPIPPGVDCPF